MNELSISFTDRDGGRHFYVMKSGSYVQISKEDNGDHLISVVDEDGRYSHWLPCAEVEALWEQIKRK